MSNQMTINNSFFNKLELVGDELVELVEDELVGLASTAVDLSPVDTGAYVTSFSFVRKGSGGGRSRTSNNKPTGQSISAMRDQGFSQLMSDIKTLDIKSTDGAVLKNRSPHSNDVEDGGPNWRRSGYGVFRQLRAMYG